MPKLPADVDDLRCVSQGARERFGTGAGDSAPGADCPFHQRREWQIAATLLVAWDWASMSGSEAAGGNRVKIKLSDDGGRNRPSTTKRGFSHPAFIRRPTRMRSCTPWKLEHSMSLQATRASADELSRYWDQRFARSFELAAPIGMALETLLYIPLAGATERNQLSGCCFRPAIGR